MKVFIGIGSNLGSRFENIRKALKSLANGAIENLIVSAIFETPAILPQNALKSWDIPYFNLVAAGTTELSPVSLLTKLKEIEQSLGRNLQAPKWSPRIIDLDILAFGEHIVRENLLTIPHPELINRPFLLHLMATLQPSWRYPVSGLPYSHLTLSEIIHTLPHKTESMRCFAPFPQLVGIVNITPDSFSDGGRYFEPHQAIQKIQELFLSGAAVIDIGAQSTRPGAQRISSEEEWHRLEPVLKHLKHLFSNIPIKPKISLDSYYPEVIKQAFNQYPIDWINDVQGGKDPAVIKLAAKKGCSIVLNHSLTIPPSKESVLPFERDPAAYLKEWAEQQIDQLAMIGIPKDRIILDPGIGFGKSTFQSLNLLRRMEVLQKTGCEVLVGHSRKSFLKMLTTNCQPEFETLGISHYLAEKKVDYLRVHNVEIHQRSLAAKAMIERPHAI